MKKIPFDSVHGVPDYQSLSERQQSKLLFRIGFKFQPGAVLDTLGYYGKPGEHYNVIFHRVRLYLNRTVQ